MTDKYRHLSVPLVDIDGSPQRLEGYDDLRATLATAEATIQQQAETIRQQDEQIAMKDKLIARLERQARAISVLLSSAGCSAMPIVDGVRWLARKNGPPIHRITPPRLSGEPDTDAVLSLLAQESMSDKEAAMQAEIDGWVRIAAQNAKDANDRLAAAEATIASLTAERDALKATLRGLPPTFAAGLLQQQHDELDTLRAERDRLHAALKEASHED